MSVSGSVAALLSKDVYIWVNSESAFVTKPSKEIESRLAWQVFNMPQPDSNKRIVLNSYGLCQIDRKHFFARPYVNEREKRIVIAISGTKEILSGNKLSKQTSRNLRGFFQQQFDAHEAPKDYYIALSYMDFLKQQLESSEKYSAYEIIFVGHSRGGLLAELLAIKYGYPAVTIESTGGSLEIARTLFSKDVIGTRETNIISYVAHKNIANSSLGKHINGVVYCPWVGESLKISGSHKGQSQVNRSRVDKPGRSSSFLSHTKEKIKSHELALRVHPINTWVEAEARYRSNGIDMFNEATTKITIEEESTHKWPQLKKSNTQATSVPTKGTNCTPRRIQM